MKRSTTLFAKTSQQAKEVQRSSNKWNLCQGWTEDGRNLQNSNMCSHVRISLTTMRGSSSFHRTRHVNLLREDWSLTFGSWWRSFAGCSIGNCTRPALSCKALHWWDGTKVQIPVSWAVQTAVHQVAMRSSRCPPLLFCNCAPPYLQSHTLLV